MIFSVVIASSSGSSSDRPSAVIACGALKLSRAVWPSGCRQDYPQAVDKAVLMLSAGLSAGY